MRKHSSVCAAFRAAQLPHLTTALLVHSPSAKAGTIPMNVAFPEANLASHILRMCPATWQDQFNLHEEGLNPWTCVCFFNALRLLSEYVLKKDPMHNPQRKLLQKARKETRDPVRSLLTKYLRKLVPRSIATCARNMGAHIPHTTHKIVEGTRRTETKNPTSEQPRKALRNPIPQSSLSHNYARK